MHDKILTSISILFLLAIISTACSGASANAEAAPATVGPTLEPTLPSSTNTPSSAPTDPVAPPATVSGAASPASISFTNDVMPILESRCIKCHGGEQTKEGLDMKTYASLMAGSKNGPVLTPGSADDSFLVRQLLDGEMPKRGPKLTPDQIQTIVDWINAGALDN